MIPKRSILDAFIARLSSATNAVAPGIGLTATKVRPVFGLPLAVTPSAQIAATGLAPGDESTISRTGGHGRRLDATLYLFAANEVAKLEYLDALDVLYDDYGALLVSGQEVEILWGAATAPEPLPEADKTTHHQLQQAVTFLWD